MGVLEDIGDAGTALSGDHLTVRETYLTQYMTQVPLETNTSVAAIKTARMTRIALVRRYMSALDT